METTVKPGMRIKVGTIYKSLLVMALIISAVFAYFYLVNRNPFTNVSIPVGPPGAPAFSHFIYGGFGDDQLWKPMAVTTIGEKVFVSDTNNYRVQVFSKDGASLGMFGARGYAPGEFQFPYGLTGDAQGRLLVGDMYTGNISVFDQEGNFIEYFGMKNDVAKFVTSPTDITFVEGKLYVADALKNRVFVFDESGKLVLEVGEEFDELGAPNGVTVDKKTGEIYVVDTRHARVIVYDKEGQVLGQFDGSKDGNSPVLSNPRGIGIDSKGVIYVVSAMSNLIYGYNEQAEQLFVFGGMGDGQGQFMLPNGLHIDERNNVYITDSVNNRISVFR